ncbi:MAG TPA: recombination mediator RecR, partial [Bacteroidales bacterium]|nr:recombination mediator RecR [Bacteroidales bacterium]
MSFSEYPSKLLENAVNEFASLPGIGRKTAFRLVLNLLKRDPGEVKKFGESIIKLRSEINYCKSCHSISDSETCSICSDSGRDSSIICVVENIQDVMAVENTRQFRGIYHVLGGVISPVDGIGPADLWIDSLEEKVKEGGVKEVIMALSTTMEGDTTNFYLYRRLNKYNILLTTLARGVAVGD